jgi:hypothetical protein
VFEEVINILLLQELSGSLFDGSTNLSCPVLRTAKSLIWSKLLLERHFKTLKYIMPFVHMLACLSFPVQVHHIHGEPFITIEVVGPMQVPLNWHVQNLLCPPQWDWLGK